MNDVLKIQNIRITFSGLFRIRRHVYVCAYDLTSKNATIAVLFLATLSYFFSGLNIIFREFAMEIV